MRRGTQDGGQLIKSLNVQNISAFIHGRTVNVKSIENVPVDLHLLYVYAFVFGVGCTFKCNLEDVYVKYFQMTCF